jgi:hypothetical protein
VNFSRTKKDLELRKYNKIRKEVDNTKPKGRSKREDWRRRGWEQVCCWWCIESGRVPCARRNCSIEASRACSVMASYPRDMSVC